MGRSVEELKRYEVTDLKELKGKNAIAKSLKSKNVQ